MCFVALCFVFGMFLATHETHQRNVPSKGLNLNFAVICLELVKTPLPECHTLFHCSSFTSDWFPVDSRFLWKTTMNGLKIDEELAKSGLGIGKE